MDRPTLIQNFIDSASKLSDQWDELGLNDIGDYPKYMPSFDDFINDMYIFFDQDK